MRYLKNLYRHFKTRPTTVSIMSGFQRQIDQLECLEAECVQEEETLARIISDADAQRNAAYRERLRAWQLANKLSEFISE